MQTTWQHKVNTVGLQAAEADNLQRGGRLDEISFPQLARQFIRESDAWTCLTLHHHKHSHHSSSHRHPITRQQTREAFGTMAEFSWHPGLNLQNNIYLSGDGGLEQLGPA